MEKVLAFYNLKPGVTFDAFKEWSIAVDQKTAIFQPGVHRFEVYAVDDSIEGGLPFQVVEDVDVESWETWQKVLKSEAMKEVVDTWGEYGDESTLKVIRCTRIK